MLRFCPQIHDRTETTYFLLFCGFSFCTFKKFENIFVHLHYWKMITLQYSYLDFKIFFYTCCTGHRRLYTAIFCKLSVHTYILYTQNVLICKFWWKNYVIHRFLNYFLPLVYEKIYQSSNNWKRNVVHVQNVFHWKIYQVAPWFELIATGDYSNYVHSLQCVNFANTVLTNNF